MSISTQGYTYGAVDQATKTQVVTLNGWWFNWDPQTIFFYPDQFLCAVTFYYSIFSKKSGGSYSGYPYNTSTGKIGYTSGCNGGGSYSVQTIGTSGNLIFPPKCDCDSTYYFYAKVEKTGPYTGTQTGSVLSFKAYSIDAVIDAPTFGSPTYNSCSVSCDYTPNTVESTATVTIQYKKTSDSTWTDSSITVSGASGYTEATLSGTLTGLEASTTYQVRGYATRNTVNLTSTTGAVASFTTTAASPTITTNVATNVASLSAILNGTVNPNGISTTYHFEWGTTVGYGNTTDSQGPGSGTSNVPYSQSITGLSYSTTYHFRAVAVAGGVSYYGDDAQFVTLGDPGVQAASQSHIVKLNYNGIYGQASTFYFPLMPAGSSGNFDSFMASNVLSSGDVTAIDKSGNSLGTVTAGYISGALFYCSPTALQMSNELIYINIKDQSSPIVFREAQIVVRTKEYLGKALIDPTNRGSNYVGLTIKGVGTQPAIDAEGGATATSDIDGDLGYVGGMLASTGGRVSYTTATTDLIYLASGSSTTDDYYNGLICLLVAGTGAGQARVITDYDYSTGGTPNPSYKATVQPAWTTLPSATDTDYILLAGDETWMRPLTELSALPSTSGSSGEKLQLLFQRFAFKIIMNATIQTWYKSDNTVLFTREIQDTTAQQVLGKLED